MAVEDLTAKFVSDIKRGVDIGTRRVVNVRPASLFYTFLLCSSLRR